MVILLRRADCPTIGQRACRTGRFFGSLGVKNCTEKHLPKIFGMYFLNAVTDVKTRDAPTSIFLVLVLVLTVAGRGCTSQIGAVLKVLGPRPGQV